MLDYCFCMSSELENVSQNAVEIASDGKPLVPSPGELAVLSKTERAGFWLTHWMNGGPWKAFWTFCQRHVGSLWIFIATYNLMNVFGIENVENTDADRPLLLVANHRSFFDMYTVSSVLFRRTKRPMRLYFPHWSPKGRRSWRKHVNSGSPCRLSAAMA